MHFFTVILSALLSFNLMAGIADLSYRAEEKSFLYKFDFGYTMADYSVTTSDGLIKDEYEQKKMFMYHNFSYGLLEELSLGLLTSYMIKGKTENTKDSTGATLLKDTESKGLGDLGLYGDWNFYDDFSLLTQLNFSLGDREVAISTASTATDDGNNYSGGHSGKLEVNYVRFFTPELELKAAAYFQYNLGRDSTVLALSGGVKSEYEYDSRFDLGGGISSQYKLFEAFYLGAILGYNFQGEDEADIKQNGVKVNKTVTDSVGSYFFKLLAKYLFMENFYGQLAFGMNFYENYIVDVKNTAGTSVYKLRYEDYKDMTIFLGLGVGF